MFSVLLCLEAGSHYKAQAALKSENPLPQSPECWNHWCVLTQQAWPDTALSLCHDEQPSLSPLSSRLCAWLPGHSKLSAEAHPVAFHHELGSPFWTV